MDFDYFLTRLATNVETIRQLTIGVSDEQARWKPDADTWSVLEVINHLYDEERLDFRPRLDFILRQLDGEPPHTDQHGWVTKHAYSKRQLDESLNDFLREREASLKWLRGLSSPDWEAKYTASWGSIKAGDMFSAWVTHDILHMRQLVELHYAWTTKQAQPYDVEYAGEW